MLVTVVTQVSLNTRFVYGGILLVALIACLIVKEITAGNRKRQLAALHHSLRVAWVPLAMIIAVILGQQLFHGIL